MISQTGLRRSMLNISLRYHHGEMAIGPHSTVSAPWAVGRCSLASMSRHGESIIRQGGCQPGAALLPE